MDTGGPKKMSRAKPGAKKYMSNSYDDAGGGVAKSVSPRMGRRRSVVTAMPEGFDQLAALGGAAAGTKTMSRPKPGTKKMRRRSSLMNALQGTVDITKKGAGAIKSGVLGQAKAQAEKGRESKLRAEKEKMVQELAEALRSIPGSPVRPSTGRAVTTLFGNDLDGDGASGAAARAMARVAPLSSAPPFRETNVFRGHVRCWVADGASSTVWAGMRNGSTESVCMWSSNTDAGALTVHLVGEGKRSPLRTLCAVDSSLSATGDLASSH